VSHGGASPSPWRDTPAFRWLIVIAALSAGLGLVGMPWQDASQLAPAPGPASFERDGAGGPQAAAPAAPADARGPTAVPPPPPATGADSLPAVPATPARAAPVRAVAADRTAPNQKQSYSAVGWMAPPMMPIVISGSGLIASAGGTGGTHTALASRGVAEGRHYLELTLSIPAGEGGPSTWSGVGVVPMSTLQHGRVVMPMITNGLGVSVGGRRGRQFLDGDIVMLAIDLNEKLAFWGVNGEWMNGAPGAQGGQALPGGAGEQWTPFANVTASDNNRPERNRPQPQGGERWVANFGASPFKYTLPAGFDSYGSVAASGQRGAPTAASPSTMPSPRAAAALAPPAPDSLMGKRFQDIVKVQDQTIPLPAGSWIVLAHFRDPGSGRARGDAVVLGRLEDNKLRGLVAINALQASGGASAAPFEACNRQDYVFRQVDTYDAQGEQRCWWINHAVSVWQNQGVFQAAQGELTRLGASAPQVMLNVAMRRADATGFATTYYYFDPAADGIASDSGSWAESEWHRSRIDNDSARRAYVQKLQRWGESWAQIYFKSK
jgi:hypothetical protein